MEILFKALILWKLLFQISYKIEILGADAEILEKSYSDILNSLKFPNNLSFDITKLINKQPETADISQELYTRNIYISLDAIAFTEILLPLKIQNLLKETTKNSANLTIYFKNRSNITNELFLKIITDFKLKWKHVKVAVEQNYNLVLQSNFKNTDAFVLEINLNQTILTYHQFKNLLKDSLLQNVNFTKPTLLLKLNFIKDQSEANAISNKMYQQRHFYFLLKFSVYWINDNNPEGIILQGFTKDTETLNIFHGISLRKQLTPEIAFHYNDNVCFFRFYMNLIYSSFDQVLLDNWFTCVFRKDLQTCSVSCSSLNSCEKFPKIFQNFDVSPGNSNTDIRLATCVKNINKSLSNYPIKSLILYVPEKERASAEHLEKIENSSATELNRLTSLNISLACMLEAERNYEISLEQIENRCKFAWNKISKVIISFDKWTHIFSQNIETFLETSLRLNTAVKEKYPDMEVIIRARNQQPFAINTNFPLYCDPDKLKVNLNLERIINFGRIHNISFITNNYGRYGWFGELKVLEEFRNCCSSKYPIFVARNYPEHQLILTGDKIPLEKCIHWTSQVSRGKERVIQFDWEYAGVTLYLDYLGNLNESQEGLQNMIMLAIYKFSLVELFPQRLADIELLVKAFLDKKFVNYLSKQEKMRFYLKFDCNVLDTETNSDLIMQHLKVIKLAGIHLTNCGNILKSNTATFPKYLQNLSLNKQKKIGVYIENCVEFVQNHFKDIINDRTVNFQFDYVICNFNVQKGSENHDQFKMESFVDSILYVDRFYKLLNPKNDSIQFIFKLNTFPTTENSNRVNDNDKIVENFLKFFNDMSQFAHLYKIKLLLFPAFDNSKPGGESHFGWWKVLDFHHFSNISVFIEKEAEHLGRESWYPKPEVKVEEKQLSPVNNLLKYFFIAGTMAVVTFTVSLIFYVWYRKSLFTVLSRTEVKYYLSGEIVDWNNDKLTMKNGKFPKQYEIKKDQITLLNILGKGNFGLVYNAQLILPEDDTGKTTYFQNAAVKIPIPGCSKEKFKTLLIELRTLCYLGKHGHPNVIKFICAYVQDIGRGELSIATELCENGSLQNYLRKKNPTKDPNCKTESDSATNLIYLAEFHRFSHEISLGMEYVGSKNIVHGDLSTRNILLDNNLTCKVADFGLSQKNYRNYKESIKKQNKTPLPWQWLALESLQNLQFTVKSDVWSYGITLWEIYSLGHLPYLGWDNWTDNFVKWLTDGNRLSAPSQSPTEIYKQMKSCWNSSPEQRPTFTQLANFFANLRNVDYLDLAERA